MAISPTCVSSIPGSTSTISDLEVEAGGVGHGTIIRSRSPLADAPASTDDRCRARAWMSPHRVRHEFKPGDHVHRHATTPPRACKLPPPVKAPQASEFFERLFASRVMRGIYADADEPELINTYARQRATSGSGCGLLSSRQKPA
jgi:hypothetical protein